MQNIRVVFVTAPINEAQKIARGIVEHRLAACVNLIPKVESFYWWEEKVQTSEESILMIKTTQAKLDQLVEYITAEHSYELPEILALPVTEGLPEYVNWILEETGSSH